MALLCMGSDECCRVPPGFRFHPTDEELINYYLRKKVGLEKFDLEVIREVDINKLEPWDLQERCQVDSTQQMDWYFFSHKDRKYPSGTRTNRATLSGFWKATGRDKAVNSSSKRIGMRKTLVFYRGRAPHGTKTDWIMHEYRLEEIDADNVTIGNEEGWVVCRVFKKHNPPKHKGNHHEQYAPPSISFEDKGNLNTTTMPKMLDYNWKDGLPSLVTCKQELVNYNNANNHILESSELSPQQMNSMSMDMDQLFRRLDSYPSAFPEFLGSSDSSNNSTKSPFISEELIIEYCNTSGGGGHLRTNWDVIESIYEEKNTTTTEDNTMNSNELLDVFFPTLHPISRPQLSELYNLNISEGETWSLPR